MNDLEKIKNILFGNEKKALDSLVRRLERPEARTADVADVLPDAVTRSYNTDERLGKALSQPLESTLSEAIRREPKKFADALFPVMGPAIRKAISEAIKSTLQTINTAIEEKSIGNRIRAARAGVPLAEYVFLKSVVYRVDEVYLVDPESGRLIHYLHHRDVDSKDEDAVSAMLTAIQDFVRDSFSKGTGGGLQRVAIDEYTVLVSQGPHAMLACVVRGGPPQSLLTNIDAANERVHLRHAEALAEFDGQAGSIAGLDAELETLLQVQKQETAATRPLFGWKSKLLALGVLLLVGYLIANAWTVNQKMRALADLVRATPGILTTELARDGHRAIAIEGLRDPLAPQPLDLARQVGIDPKHFTASFLPFQSLEAAIIEQRAQSTLEPPAGVSLTFEDGTLSANGSAAAGFRERFINLAPLLGGVTDVDATQLRLDDASLLKSLEQALEPPPTVDLSVTQAVAVVSGSAPQAWHDKLQTVKTLVPGITDVNRKALKLEERVTLAGLVASLHNRAVFFSSGDQLVPNQEAQINRTATRLRSYEELAIGLGLKPVVRVIGEVDGSGDPRVNESLMARRASVYREALIAYGVNAALLRIEASAVPQSEVVDPAKRRAIIKMSSQ
ncbi:MAG: hypothetical protein AAF465_01025 [Pseudomonadota bacterium]